MRDEGQATEEALGIQQPLVPPVPLGQSMLQPRFMTPLGTRSLAVLNPSIFLSAQDSVAPDWQSAFEDSPFFDTPAPPDSPSANTQTIQASRTESSVDSLEGNYISSVEQINQQLALPQSGSTNFNLQTQLNSPAEPRLIEESFSTEATQLENLPSTEATQHYQDTFEPSNSPPEQPSYSLIQRHSESQSSLELEGLGSDRSVSDMPQTSPEDAAFESNIEPATIESAIAAGSQPLTEVHLQRQSESAPVDHSLTEPTERSLPPESSTSVEAVAVESSNSTVETSVPDVTEISSGVSSISLQPASSNSLPEPSTTFLQPEETASRPALNAGLESIPEAVIQRSPEATFQSSEIQPAASPSQSSHQLERNNPIEKPINSQPSESVSTTSSNQIETQIERQIQPDLESYSTQASDDSSSVLEDSTTLQPKTQSHQIHLESDVILAQPPSETPPSETNERLVEPLTHSDAITSFSQPTVQAKEERTNLPTESAVIESGAIDDSPQSKIQTAPSTEPAAIESSAIDGSPQPTIQAKEQLVRLSTDQPFDQSFSETNSVESASIAASPVEMSPIEVNSIETNTIETEDSPQLGAAAKRESLTELPDKPDLPESSSTVISDQSVIQAKAETLPLPLIESDSIETNPIETEDSSQLGAAAKEERLTDLPTESTSTKPDPAPIQLEKELFTERFDESRAIEHSTQQSNIPLQEPQLIQPLIETNSIETQDSPQPEIQTKGESLTELSTVESIVPLATEGSAQPALQAKAQSPTELSELTDSPSLEMNLTERGPEISNLSPEPSPNSPALNSFEVQSPNLSNLGGDRKVSDTVHLTSEIPFDPAIQAKESLSESSTEFDLHEPGAIDDSAQPAAQVKESLIESPSEPDLIESGSIDSSIQPTIQARNETFDEHSNEHPVELVSTELNQAESSAQAILQAKEQSLPEASPEFPIESKLAESITVDSTQSAIQAKEETTTQLPARDLLSQVREESLEQTVESSAIAPNQAEISATQFSDDAIAPHSTEHSTETSTQPIQTSIQPTLQAKEDSFTAPESSLATPPQELAADSHRDRTAADSHSEVIQPSREGSLPSTQATSTGQEQETLNLATPDLANLTGTETANRDQAIPNQSDRLNLEPLIQANIAEIQAKHSERPLDSGSEESSVTPFEQSSDRSTNRPEPHSYSLQEPTTNTDSSSAHQTLDIQSTDSLTGKFIQSPRPLDQPAIQTSVNQATNQATNQPNQTEALPDLPTVIQRLSVWEPLTQLQPLQPEIATPSPETADPPSVQSASAAPSQLLPDIQPQRRDRPIRESALPQTPIQPPVQEPLQSNSVPEIAASTNSQSINSQSINSQSTNSTPTDWSSIAELFQRSVEPLPPQQAPDTPANGYPDLQLYPETSSTPKDMLQKQSNGSTPAVASPEAAADPTEASQPPSSETQQLQASPEHLERLALEVYRLVRQRLAVERERVGPSYPRRSL